MEFVVLVDRDWMFVSTGVHEIAFFSGPNNKIALLLKKS